MASRARGRGRLEPRAGFRQAQQPTTGVHPAMLKQARKSGQLNLSNRSLTEVPDTVWRINMDLPEESKSISLDKTDDQWWDQVDLTKLILASNQLKALSDDIQQLPALTVLDVHDNQLESLPETIGSLGDLSSMNLGHNKLTNLPVSMSQLQNLKSLHMEHNQFQELPEWLGRLRHIQDLDISNNQITAIPDFLGYLTSLVKLNISYNKIKVLPHEIGRMQGLRVLDATHNSLHTLPDSLGELPHLEQLYLRHNRLAHLPVLTHCKNIKEVHVGNNALQSLTPDHLEAMSSVHVLDVRDNKLGKLPEEITVLEQLERLDLTNNDLSGLPYVLGTLPNLKAIVLDGNPMKSIRRDIIMRGTNEIKKYLCSRIEEPAQPEKVKAVKTNVGSSGVIGGGDDGIDAHAVGSTKVLVYSEKKATEIPDDVWSLVSKTEITTINFSKNSLSQWPDNLVLAADNLLDLNLGFNKLSSLPADSGLFLQLKVLDLRNNMLTTLPKEMCSLQNLRDLTLAVNRLREIPAVVYELRKLENLLVSDNQVGVLDVVGLLRLEKLATLDLQNNDLTTIPPELGNCPSLRSLQLGGNPCRNPRPAILAKGTPALLEYLQGRIPTS